MLIEDYITFALVWVEMSIQLVNQIWRDLIINNFIPQRYGNSIAIETTSLLVQGLLLVFIIQQWMKGKHTK